MISKRLLILYFVLGIIISYISFLYFLGPNGFGKALVIVTEKGFYPGSITVGEGTEVLWINMDSRPRWPASDFHPTHRQYPDGGGCLGSRLDACRGLERGEVFSFRFEEIGEWGIHDHLLPASSMVINVIKNSSYVNTIKKDSLINDSLPDSAQFRNFSDQKKKDLIISVSKSDPKSAWKYLKEVSIVGNVETEGVHELAHIVGNSLYKKYGLSGNAACSSEFAYGCYHGVAEQLLIESGPAAGIGELQEECLKESERKGSAKPLNIDPGCAHGAGHGLLSWHNLDLEAALEDCDIFSNKLFQNSCYDGVFMEHTFSMPLGNINLEDPWSNCDFEKLEHKERCGGYLPHLLSRDNSSQDIGKLYETCKQVSEITVEDQCKRSLAIKIALDSEGSEKGIVTGCGAFLLKDDIDFCISWAAQGVRFHKYSNWENVSEALCLRLPGDGIAECRRDML